MSNDANIKVVSTRYPPFGNQQLELLPGSFRSPTRAEEELWSERPLDPNHPPALRAEKSCSQFYTTYSVAIMR